MAVSTTKKGVIRRFDREPVEGFLNPHEYLRPEGVEVLTPAGALLYLAYGDVKSISFVKDFDTPCDAAKVFRSRPKMEGLWVRMKFRDGDFLEGILPNQLLLWDAYGYSVIPPEPYANNQKIFVPKLALNEIHVLGVVGSPLKKAPRKKEVSREQISLFD